MEEAFSKWTNSSSLVSFNCLRTKLC